MKPTAPQPPPTGNRHQAIWPLVIKDMLDRDSNGERKYGCRLQPYNGRDPLVDAYQEALDLVVYLRQAIEERRRPVVVAPPSEEQWDAIDEDEHPVVHIEDLGRMVAGRRNAAIDGVNA